MESFKVVVSCTTSENVSGWTFSC